MSSSNTRGLVFSSMSYSVAPIFALPAGRTRFCALIAFTTSCAVRFSALSAFMFRSTDTNRVFPPYGHGTDAPCTVDSPMRI